MTTHSIESGHVSARIDNIGAQLRSLTVDGVEYLWAAKDPWEWSAPVLFPLISGLPSNQMLHKGQRYPIVSHGFGRRSQFELDRHESNRISFLLTTSAQTLAAYPFAFALEIEFVAAGRTLTVNHTVSNRSDEPMPFQLGGHPAFCWPLPGAEAGSDHTVSWLDGGDTMRMAVGGLRPGRIPSPAVDGRLVLDRAQFVEDGMLFDDIDPRRVTYTAPGAARIVLNYDDFSRLGIWSKPQSGDFVCLEPWSGYPAPQGFDRDIMDLPEGTILGVGESRTYSFSITVEGA